MRISHTRKLKTVEATMSKPDMRKKRMDTPKTKMDLGIEAEHVKSSTSGVLDKSLSRLAMMTIPSRSARIIGIQVLKADMKTVGAGTSSRGQRERRRLWP